jgi:hypothetical protein
MGYFLVRSGREGNQKALRNNLEIKKKLDHVITVKNHQTQPQTKYGKNQYQTFLKFIGFCMN